MQWRVYKSKNNSSKFVSEKFVKLAKMQQNPTKSKPK
jgi:hypothetical protein